LLQADQTAICRQLPERFILFAMTEAPYSVSVVLDRDFGERIRELLEAGPVWVVDSALNQTSAQSI
jgi:hypothetical protein